MADSFKNAWKNFQRIVLLNDGDLQLLVAYRGYQGRNAEFSQIIRQEDVEGVGETVRGRQYGIKAGDDLIKDSIDALKASQVEQFLQKHLNDFLNQLESSIDKDQAHKIHLYHEYCLANYLQNTPIHITGMSWIYAFITSNSSSYYSGQGLGKAYDAFMNHMANKETGIYNYLRSNGMSSVAEKMTFRSQSVYIEEHGVEPEGTFAELLKAGQNSIGWYTGGDIVIVSPQTMEIVYNIQLKTTTRNRPSVFAEKVEAIRKFLQGFNELTPEQKGAKIFDFFLTSISNYDAFNSLPQKDIDQLIEDGVGKKFQEKLNIILKF